MDTPPPEIEQHSSSVVVDATLLVAPTVEDVAEHVPAPSLVDVVEDPVSIIDTTEAPRMDNAQGAHQILADPPTLEDDEPSAARREEHHSSTTSHGIMVDDDPSSFVQPNELDDLVAAMSSHESAGVPNDVEMASVATPMGGFALHDLFGEHFHTGLLPAQQQGEPQDDWDTTGGGVIDPELLDSRTFIENLFGHHVDETMINPSEAIDTARPPLHSLMRDAAAADARADVQTLFGEHVKHMDLRLDETEEQRGGFEILYASLPKLPTQLGQSTGDLWLAELPKVDPNRQVLHVDPTLFVPSRNGEQLPPNSDRRLYTTQNIMRWTYLKQNKQVLSNARLVCWSDGSRTVHVGQDRFEVAQSSQNSLALLSAPSSVRTADGKAPPGSSTMVGVQGYDNRVLIKVSDAPSISREIVEETQGHREIGMERRLGFTTALALPQMDAKKAKADMSSEDQWVSKEREKRRKEKERRAAEGNAMSFLEEFDEERKMMEKLRQCTNIQTLLDEQQADLRGHLVNPGEVAYVKGAGRRFRQPEELSTTAPEDVDDEFKLSDIMASMNSEPEMRKSTKRDRSATPTNEDPTGDPMEQVPRTEKNNSHDVADAGSTLWNIDYVRKQLTATHSALPPGTEVCDFVASVLALLGSQNTAWTEAKLRAEVAQVVTDISQELGGDHPALEYISSLRAEL